MVATLSSRLTAGIIFCYSIVSKQSFSYTAMMEAHVTLTVRHHATRTGKTLDECFST